MKKHSLTKFIYRAKITSKIISGNAFYVNNKVSSICVIVFLSYFFTYCNAQETQFLFLAKNLWHVVNFDLGGVGDSKFSLTPTNLISNLPRAIQFIDNPLSSFTASGRDDVRVLSSDEMLVCEELLKIELTLKRNLIRARGIKGLDPAILKRLESLLVVYLYTTFDKSIDKKTIINSLRYHKSVNMRDFSACRASSRASAPKRGPGYSDMDLIAISDRFMQFFWDKSAAFEAVMAHELGHLVFNDVRNCEKRLSEVYRYFSGETPKVPDYYNFDYEKFKEWSIPVLKLKLESDFDVLPKNNHKDVEVCYLESDKNNHLSADIFIKLLNEESNSWKKGLERRADLFAARIIGLIKPFLDQFSIFEVMFAGSISQQGPHDSYGDRLKLIQDYLDDKIYFDVAAGIALYKNSGQIICDSIYVDEPNYKFYKM